MKKKYIALTAAAAMVFSGAADCTANSGPGSGQPPASVGSSSYPAKTAVPASVAAVPPVPVVSADAAGALNPNRCVMYMDPDGVGFQMYDFTHAIGQVYVKCTMQAPTFILVMITIQQYIASAKQWVNVKGSNGRASEVVTAVGRPQPGDKLYAKIIFLCTPGKWRLKVAWHGLKADGKTYFPDYAEGDSVPDNFYTPVWPTDCT